MATATTGKSILSALRNHLDLGQYSKVHWEGTLEEFLDIVHEHPEVTRNSYQRLYDMILSHGTEEYYENKEKIIRFKFFNDFALQLRRRHLRPRSHAAAAGQYLQVGRLRLRHRAARAAVARPGRLVQEHHRPPAQARPGRVFAQRRGHAVYSFSWKGDNGTWVKDPMHGDPLAAHPGRPARRRSSSSSAMRSSSRRSTPSTSRASCAPSAGTSSTNGLQKYNGDVPAMLANEVKVYRMVLSEQDRIGIGTFQPKDEKNQDSTELTGDINYRKIAEYGSDSDPRAFNFDGELNIANRGLVEFIEVLKLDVAFLYDLLGASQEHKIKPKKFAQTDIDEVILGAHQRAGVSPLAEQRVHGSTARPHREDRRAVRHPTVRRDQNLREVVQPRKSSRQAHRPAHHRGGGDVGGADPAGTAQAREPDALAKDEALQRQDAAGLHRGQHHRAETRGRPTKACTASARATSRTRSPTPWWPTRRRTTSTRSWCCTSWKPVCATTRSSPARSSSSTSRSCCKSSNRSTRTS